MPVDRALDHVFGVVLLNDWSARDIQGWETVPLGPFLGKSFATSISHWVVPLDALERTAREPQDPPPLAVPAGGPWAFDLALELELNGTVVARTNAGELYWSAAQQIAHLTVNGASLRTGDLLGSGTISGPGARRARLAARAELERGGAGRARRRLDAHASWRTATRSCCAADAPRRGARPHRAGANLIACVLSSGPVRRLTFLGAILAALALPGAAAGEPSGYEAQWISAEPVPDARVG